MYLVKPISGKRVRHPETKKVLDEAGCRIESVTTYWYRRQQDGDVEISAIQADASSAPKQPKKSAASAGVSGSEV